MKRNQFVTLLCAVVLLACDKDQPNETHATTVKDFTPKTCPCYAQSEFDNVEITFSDSVPGDLTQFNSQSKANCFAWQSFIALNWPTAPNKEFGQPGDLSFVQWENYMPKDVLFNENGTKPPAWGTLVSKNYAKKFNAQEISFDKQETKLLTFFKKISDDEEVLEDLDFHQAAPFDKPNWLGAQNSTNLWYEIMLNKDYYDFVVEKGYYNAQAQHDSIRKGVAMQFPEGRSSDGFVGAIELKAAWMEVVDTSLTKWNRYKLSKAVVLDPFYDTLRTTVVALVGLHILHKTQNQPTWVWATFEQVDNVPGSSDAPHGYNFHNPNCTNKDVTLKNDSVVTVMCTPNTTPPYYLNEAAPVPIQVTRVNPIDPQNAAPINKAMQDTIASYFKGSVWQYYELVDVIWSQVPQPSGSTIYRDSFPLITSGMQPPYPGNIVANTTMETYVQSSTCFNCHMFSTIANYPPDSTNDNAFGDFSFAIGFAGYTANKEDSLKLSKYLEKIEK